MTPIFDESLHRALLEKTQILNQPRDLSPLVDQICNAKIVMLGEASHGTQEFYHWRRVLTEWLISKHGFNFIAVEGDWPPCAEINRYIQSQSGGSARETLESFRRWPTWMWGNTEIVRLAEWLRTHNQSASEDRKVGFHGLDVYSLFESIDVVLSQLKKINPFLAKQASIHYACFERFRRDEKAYAKSLISFPEGCEEEALEALQKLLNFRLSGVQSDEDVLFDAQQNARIVANAENYYRTMIHGDEDSWNVRDRHMRDTLEILLNRLGPDSRAIVWAHNTHIGDYRATSMAAERLVNLGGLARETWGEEHVALVGFGTYEGEVIASHAWDGPIETLPVVPAREGSYEAALHDVSEQLNVNSVFLPHLNTPEARAGALSSIRGHRAIGVVYQPEHERFGNYVPTRLSQRYDAFVFIDRSTALEPLIQGIEPGKIPETWPQGQ